MAGSSLMAVVWVLAVGLVLLGWPWLLARVGVRRPGWFAPDAPPATDALRAAWGRIGSGDPRDLIGWAALLVLAAVVPAGRGLHAADLDAGLLWLFLLAVSSWLAAGRGALPADRAAGAAVALMGATMPVVMRTATLNLVDIVVAQQGGAGNWFLVREPFLLLAGGVFLVTVAASWRRTADGDRTGDAWSVASAWGRPLVASLVFAVLFLGGWWAFVPFLDGVPWLNTVIKTLVVFVVLLALRRWSWVTPSLLARRLPVAALGIALASLAWLVLGGGVR